MTDKHLEELATEIKASAVAEKDRAVLEQVHTELQAVLSSPAPVAAPPLGLRDKLTRAI